MNEKIIELIASCKLELLDLFSYNFYVKNFGKLLIELEKNHTIKKVRFSPNLRAILAITEADQNNAKVYQANKEVIDKLTHYSSDEPSGEELSIIEFLRQDSIIETKESQDKFDIDFVQKISAFLGDEELFDKAVKALVEIMKSKKENAAYASREHSISHLCHAFIPRSYISMISLKHRLITLKKLYFENKYLMALIFLSVRMQDLGAGRFVSKDFNQCISDYTRFGYDIFFTTLDYKEDTGEDIQKYIGEDIQKNIRENFLSLFREKFTDMDPKGIPFKIYIKAARYIATDLKNSLMQVKNENKYSENESLDTQRVKEQNLESVLKWESLLQNPFFSLLFFAETFDLSRGAKNSSKVCTTLDPVDGQELNIHKRQSLAERLIDYKTSDFKTATSYRPKYPQYSLAVASLGLIISDRKHVAGGQHKRKFLSLPISIEDKTIIKNVENRIHAEEALITFLNKPEEILKLLQDLKRTFSIKSPGHKAYGVILDIHGTYDMCISCYHQMANFLYVFKKTVYETCIKLGMTCPLLARFACVFRYSSDLPYYEGCSSGSEKELSTRFMKSKLVEHQMTEELRDIRSREDMVIHGKSNWHQLWVSPERLFLANGDRLPASLKLENWTAFASSAYRIPSEPYDYTTLGEVDTDVPNLEEEVSDLTSLHL